MFPPAMLLTAQLATPESRGSAMGAFNQAGSLGFAVGPLVGAWAYEARGFGFAFALVGVLEIAIAVAVAAWWWSRRDG
jgi:predicted MFS family arabinose efflux permease